MKILHITDPCTIHPSPVSNLGFSGFVLHGLVWKSGIPFYPLPGHWRGIPHLQINPFRSYGCLLIEEKHEKHVSRVYRHCWRNELIFQYVQHVHPVYHNFSVFSPINITIISPLFSTNDIFFHGKRRRKVALTWGRRWRCREVSRNFRISWGFPWCLNQKKIWFFTGLMD